MSNSCQHTFDYKRKDCPHFVPEGSTTCLWHNVTIDKSAPYVRDLLAQAIEMHQGDLEDAHLVGLSWPNAKLAGVRLRGADLRDANLAGADLNGADLRGTILRRANLQGSNLADALLTGADLTETNLNRASLRGSDLCNTTINQTNLVNADLRSADLADAMILSFSWNRLTRFHGVRGLEANPDEALDTSSTQILSPHLPWVILMKTQAYRKKIIAPTLVPTHQSLSQ